MRNFSYSGVWLVLFIWFWMSGGALAYRIQDNYPSLDRQGSCAAESADLPYSGNIGKSQREAVILRNDTPLYSNFSGSARKGTLQFDAKVLIHAVQGDRVQVYRLYAERPAGWVARDDLLCKRKPLRSPSGLEMKFFIKTEARRNSGEYGILPGVQAYQNYEGTDCGTGECRKLLRFNGYFVFDERNGRYLLGSKYGLGRKTGLMGWVDKKDGFIWDTAYGLRPRENLVFRPGHAKAGQERAVCAYETLEYALAARKINCIPILGGARWYKLPNRIPVLKTDRKNGLYRVVMALPGIGAKSASSHKIEISPELLGGMEERIKALSEISDLNHLDLFFLIDGTRSMEGPLEEVKKSVGQIVTLFTTDPDFREKQLRLGFRIYRDKYAGRREFGEGKALDMGMSQAAYAAWMERISRERRNKDWMAGLENRFTQQGCTMETSNKLESNKRAFDAALSTVTTTYEKGDDFSENLFGGIQAALEDLDASCPTHFKLLFVIGDHGYSMENQRKYGRTPVEMEALVDGLTGSREEERQQVMTFFLHTAKDKQARRKNIRAYDQAYEAFEIQAREVLSALRANARNPWELSDFFKNVNTDHLTKQIKKSVEKYFGGTSKTLEELKLDLYGGASLVAAVERLKGRKEFKNIPGLYWEIVEQHLCVRLGDQCEHSITDATIEGYIPMSDDLQVDVWFMATDVANYRAILHELSDPEIEPGRNLRENFINVLTESLERVIRKPLLTDAGEPLEVFIRRMGKLPVRHNSPIFRHSMRDLRNAVKVPKHKLAQLQEWISVVTDFFAIIQRGQRPVTYTENGETVPSRQVFKLIESEHGYKHPRGENFPDKDMSYDKRTSQGRIYWIPQEFLP